MFIEVKISRILYHDWNIANVPYCSSVMMRVKIGVDSRAMPLLSTLHTVYQSPALTGADSDAYFCFSCCILTRFAPLLDAVRWHTVPARF